MDTLLTVDEVAERLRRPVSTVRYWRATGTGPRSARLGGRVFYRTSDVETWIAEQFTSSSRPAS
jgi:predicted DNA-binding transcriptional regulator AlpA